MKIVSRTLIFATFFGNCIIIGLLLTALVSNSWIFSTAHPKTKMTSNNQIGTIEFGLFSGHQSFDHGYGVRKTNIDVIQNLKSEPEFMSYWLWLFTGMKVYQKIVKTFLINCFFFNRSSWCWI